MNLFTKDNKNKDINEPLYESFISVIKSFKKNEESFSPLEFILKLRNKLPVYAEKDKYGLYIQHDVHEFWSTLVSYISSNNPEIAKNTTISLEKK